MPSLFFLSCVQIEGGCDTALGAAFICEIIPGGVAHHAGTLRVGDRLLEINGKWLYESTQQDIVTVGAPDGHWCLPEPLYDLLIGFESFVFLLSSKSSCKTLDHW